MISIRITAFLTERAMHMLTINAIVILFGLAIKDAKLAAQTATGSLTPNLKPAHLTHCQRNLKKWE